MMARETMLRLAEALWQVRLGRETIGNKTSGANGLLRGCFASADLDLTELVRAAGADPGRTAADADFLKLSFVQNPTAEVAAPSPAAPPLTARIERDLDGRVPSNTLAIISGGLSKPLRWPEYLLTQPAILRPHLIAVKAAFEASASPPEQGICICSDGFRIGFTERAWGDFLAALDNGSAAVPTSTYIDHY